MAQELLTRKSTGWYKGCGCGQKAGDLVKPPEGSQELFIAHQGALTGPITGIEYVIVPNTTSIDIDPQDAKAFKAQGIAMDARQGMKGALTRKGSF